MDALIFFISASVTFAADYIYIYIYFFFVEMFPFSSIPMEHTDSQRNHSTNCNGQIKVSNNCFLYVLTDILSIIILTCHRLCRFLLVPG